MESGLGTWNHGLYRYKVLVCPKLCISCYYLIGNGPGAGGPFLIQDTRGSYLGCVHVNNEAGSLFCTIHIQLKMDHQPKRKSYIIIKLLEGNMSLSSSPWVRQSFLSHDAKSTMTKENRESWTSSKLKISALQETPSRKWKNNSDGEKRMQSHVPNRDFIQNMWVTQ